MARAHQICSICKREFTRRSNAERHNENLHTSQARIMSLRSFRGDGIGLHLRNKKRGFLCTNGQSEEELLADTLENIGKEFEGCEHELGLLAFQDKAVFLAQIVVQALRSDEPKQTMRKVLKILRRNRSNEVMIRYVAAGFDITPYDAKRMLINVLE